MEVDFWPRVVKVGVLFAEFCFIMTLIAAIKQATLVVEWCFESQRLWQCDMCASTQIAKLSRLDVRCVTVSDDLSSGYYE